MRKRDRPRFTFGQRFTKHFDHVASFWVMFSEPGSQDAYATIHALGAPTTVRLGIGLTSWVCAGMGERDHIPHANVFERDQRLGPCLIPKGVMNLHLLLED